MARRFITTVILTVLFLWPGPIFARTTKIEQLGTFGPLDMQVGVEVTGQLDSGQAAELVHFFSGTRIYVKVVDPGASLFSSPAFTTISSAGFRWYLTFSSGSNASSVLSAFSATGKTAGAVIELKEGAVSAVSGLKSTYPQFQYHAAEYAFWPREKVRDLVHGRPEIEVVSLYVDGPGKDVFADARLMFDTFFDAAKDIPGTSIKINYPPGKKLSLSSLRIKQNSPAGEAFAAAVVGDILTSSVQSGPAPFRFVNLGRFSQYSTELKTTFANLAKAIEGKPSLVWPRAANPNGNPYDNEFPGWENSNSKPVMGVILKGGTGLFSMIVNASSSTQNITLNGRAVSLSPYQVLREGGGEIGPAPIPPTAAPPLEPTQPVVEPQPQEPIPLPQPTVYTPTIPPLNPPIVDVPGFPTVAPFIPPPQSGTEFPDDVSVITPVPSGTSSPITLPSATSVIRQVQQVLELPRKGVGHLFVWDRLLEIYMKIWGMNITSEFMSWLNTIRH